VIYQELVDLYPAVARDISFFLSIRHPTYARPQFCPSFSLSFPAT